MRVLVTGGAGFIGSVTVEQLLARDHDVVVVDHLSTTPHATVDDSALFIEADVSDQRRLRQILSEKRIDVVLHLAAVDASAGFADPAACFELNVSGTISLLQSMNEAGVKRLILSSSTSVYGAPSELPVNEETVCKPVSPYAASRLAIEQLLPWYEHAYDLKYISLRYGTVSGASKRFGESRRSLHLIPQILNVAEGEAEHVEIFGEDYPTPDGSCIRDYLHVLDVAEAHVLAMNTFGAVGLGSRTYNLGTGSGYSVHEVVEMARQVTGRKIATECGARRAGDAAIMISNADRIMGELGWQPRNSDLDRIIESAWRWRMCNVARLS